MSDTYNEPWAPGEVPPTTPYTYTPSTPNEESFFNGGAYTAPYGTYPPISGATTTTTAAGVEVTLNATQEYCTALLSNPSTAPQGSQVSFTPLPDMTPVSITSTSFDSCANLLTNAGLPVPTSITVEQLPPMPVPVIPETEILIDAMQNPDGGIFSNGTPY